jgi:RecA/RadA recombinase
MKRKKPPISSQIKKRVSTPVKKKPALDGNTERMISTGSTLLDLAISGGRVRGGGIPGGVMVEIFGPHSSGKTVLLCEIAGAVQRGGGDVLFRDPEARLNKQFAALFGLKVKKDNYTIPNTVTQVFSDLNKWEPEGDGIHGIFTDSLAALSTDMEMDKEEGDKMGMRRAKEFSEQLRKTCRILVQNNFLLVCSNQVRESMATVGPKYKSPGGEAIGFYSSLRLRTLIKEKLKPMKKMGGKEVTRVRGVVIMVEVFKNSTWEPYRTAPITIDFKYGIDDIRENLQFVKRFKGLSYFDVNGEKLNISLEKSIQLIEKNDWEDELREEVIDLWEAIEEKFVVERKPKKR